METENVKRINWFLLNIQSLKIKNQDIFALGSWFMNLNCKQSAFKCEEWINKQTICKFQVVRISSPAERLYSICRQLICRIFFVCSFVRPPRLRVGALLKSSLSETNGSLFTRLWSFVMHYTPAPWGNPPNFIIKNSKIKLWSRAREFAPGQNDTLDFAGDITNLFTSRRRPFACVLNQGQSAESPSPFAGVI